MRRPAFIARQSRCPSGLLGRIVAHVMARETRAANRAAVAALAPAPGEHILEIGFGHGRTLALLADAAPGVTVHGVDASPDMVRAATRHNRLLVAAGRVELRQGDSSRLPYPDATFHKTLAVHTVYFWNEPLAHLAEVRRTLRPDGAFVLGFHPRTEDMVRDFPPPTYRFHSGDDILELLHEAGFDEVSLARVGSGSDMLLAHARIQGVAR